MPYEIPSVPSIRYQANELARRRTPLPGNAEALLARCAAFRRHLIEVLGHMPPRQSDLAPVVEEQVELADGLVQERVVYHPEPGDPVNAYVYRPASASGPLPAILVLHGWDVGESSRQRAKQDLAKSGYVVVVPENICSRHIDIDISEDAGFDVGTTVMGLVTFENQRALDYLFSRDDVDCDRVACVGMCWSGIQCYILSALDERIKAVCPVCGISMQGAVSTQNVFLESHSCIGTFIPGLLQVGQVQDIMALIAPRPILVQNNVNSEWLPILGLDTAEKELKTAYRALGHPERFSMETSDSNHDLTPQFAKRIIEWLGKHLGNG